MDKKKKTLVFALIVIFLLTGTYLVISHTKNTSSPTVNEDIVPPSLSETVDNENNSSEDDFTETEKDNTDTSESQENEITLDSEDDGQSSKNEENGTETEENDKTHEEDDTHEDGEESDHNHEDGENSEENKQEEESDESSESISEDDTNDTDDSDSSYGDSITQAPTPLQTEMKELIYDKLFSSDYVSTSFGVYEKVDTDLYLLLYAPNYETYRPVECDWIFIDRTTSAYDDTSNLADALIKFYAELGYLSSSSSFVSLTVETRAYQNLEEATFAVIDLNFPVYTSFSSKEEEELVLSCIADTIILNSDMDLDGVRFTVNGSPYASSFSTHSKDTIFTYDASNVDSIYALEGYDYRTIKK